MTGRRRPYSHSPDSSVVEDAGPHALAARQRQTARTGDPRLTNAALPGRLLKTHARVEAAGRSLLERAVEKLGLSARAYHRVLRVARSIADLDGAERIETPHVAEALRYRPPVASPASP